MPNETSGPLPYKSRVSPARPIRSVVVSAAKGVAFGSVAVIVGGAILVATAPTRCHGGTRSARLKWEQRRAEIDQAIAAPDETDLASEPDQA